MFHVTPKYVYRLLNYLIIRAEILIQYIAVIAKRIALVVTPYFIMSVELSQWYAYTCDHDSLCIVLKTIP